MIGFNPHRKEKAINWVFLSLGVAGLCVASSLLAFRKVNGYLALLRQRADRLAAGDLTQRIPLVGPRQVASVADAMNRMAGQLKNRLDTVVQQRGELEAVLASMSEGVVAIDWEERLIKLNDAAARILDTQPGWAIGRTIQEVVRNTTLQRLFHQVLSADQAVSGQVELRSRLAQDPSGQSSLMHLQVQGTPLRDSSGKRFGALIVLHDVTDLRRLERVRRDFVANASHEIKTPVTAIKVAVETLLDREEEVAFDPDTHHFLEMIMRQANRLQVIVEDLLSLARIEQASDQHQVDLEPGSLADIVGAAVEACQMPARSKNIRLEPDCHPEHAAMINRLLLEQAVVNLLDNAIKYSPADASVEVQTRVLGEEVTLSVQDHGNGIAAEHLDRIFERFYRTDPARSRALGGTGLGLAIVKHIVQSHHGRITVESTPGQGSRFTIHLPRIDPVEPAQPLYQISGQEHQAARVAPAPIGALSEPVAESK